MKMLQRKLCLAIEAGQVGNCSFNFVFYYLNIIQYYLIQFPSCTVLVNVNNFFANTSYYFFSIVLKMKVLKDLTNSPEDNHRYSMNIIRKVNKVSEHVDIILKAIKIKNYFDQHTLTGHKYGLTLLITMCLMLQSVLYSGNAFIISKSHNKHQLAYK